VRILEPVRVGTRDAPNRVLFGPHETNLGSARSLSDRHVAYYEERLRGGVGMLVTEEASVHDSDWPYERCPLASDCGPGWTALADLGRRHGSVVLAGIGHTGGQGASAYSQRELWAPSGVPEVNTREMPKAMELDDIAAVVRGFGDAAALAVASGLDGVEVNAGQNSLVRQFLSGLNNLRDDEYGTDRLRFAREVLHATRVGVGDGVVGLRLSCDELAPWAGIVPEAAAEIAVALLPWIDYLVVVRGGIFSVAQTRPDGHDAPGFNLDLVRDIRSAVAGRVPVFAQGSIVDVGQAEWALEDGRCDGVEMTRAQIADPQLVAKVVAGDADRIRPCILCNQTCKVRDNRNPIVSCVVEPRAGHELDDPDPAGTATRSHDVLVVGGGVAGLECARVAAARGHRVTVVERSSELGGVVRVAAAGAGRDRLALVADWLAQECERLGVAVETGVEADQVRIEAARASGVEVVLAVGATAGAPTYALEGGAAPVDATDVLAAFRAGDEQGGLPDGPIAIWDPIGGPIAVSVTELLAAHGREVALITPDLIVGTLLSRSGDLAPANTRLAGAGVRFHKRSVLRSVEPAGAVIEDRFTGNRSVVEAAAVVDAGARLPDERLFDRFEADGTRLERAGDSVAPRTVYEAVLEGRRVALAMEGRR
jgi:2,4-dienoyl-CoA reductase (NADPH2)